MYLIVLLKIILVLCTREISPRKDDELQEEYWEKSFFFFEDFIFPTLILFGKTMTKQTIAKHHVFFFFIFQHKKIHQALHTHALLDIILVDFDLIGSCNIYYEPTAVAGKNSMMTGIPRFQHLNQDD